MEDAATGEIRLSILWEWVHKGATTHRGRRRNGSQGGRYLFRGDVSTLARRRIRQITPGQVPRMYMRFRRQPRCRLLERSSRPTCSTRRRCRGTSTCLNINLNNHDLQTAQERIRNYMNTFKKDGTRITENLDTADTVIERRSGVVRQRGWRNRAVDGEPAIRRDHATVQRTSGCRAARNDCSGLFRRENGQRRHVRSAARTLSRPSGQSRPSVPIRPDKPW